MAIMASKEGAADTALKSNAATARRAQGCMVAVKWSTALFSL
jgi:hypothetical protein